MSWSCHHVQGACSSTVCVPYYSEMWAVTLSSETFELSKRGLPMNLSSYKWPCMANKPIEPPARSLSCCPTEAPRCPSKFLPVSDLSPAAYSTGAVVVCSCVVECVLSCQMGTHAIPKNSAGPEDLVTLALGLQKVSAKMRCALWGELEEWSSESWRNNIRGLG